MIEIQFCSNNFNNKAFTGEYLKTSNIIITIIRSLLYYFFFFYYRLEEFTLTQFSQNAFFN
jgi:hypothetical protein